MSKKPIPSKAKPALIVGVLLAVALGAVWFVGYQPALEERSQAASQAANARSQNAALRANIARLKQAESDRVELEKQVKEFAQQFPASADQPGTFRAIEDAATTSGVTVINRTDSVPAPVTTTAPTSGVVAPSRPGVAARPGNAGAPSMASGIPTVGISVVQQPRPAGLSDSEFPIAEVDVTVLIRGKLSAVTKFTKQIESLERPVLVQNVVVTPSDTLDKSNDPVVSSTVTMKVFSVRTIAPIQSSPQVTRTAPASQIVVTTTAGP